MKKYCRLCKKKETKSQCAFGPKMWNRYSVDDATENEVESAAADSGITEESKSGDSSLRDWFGKSKSSDGKPGWVQLGGKYSGKPCAKQPGQTTKPKCGSSKMKRNLSKDEEQKAFRKKNKKDPNPNRSGKAINVKTEEFTTLPLQIEIPNNIRDFNLGLMFRESLDINSGMLFIFNEVAEQSFHMRETKIPLDIAFIREDGTIESIKKLEPFDESSVASDGEVLCALEVNRGWFEENNVEVGDQIDIEEGEKDACYHKVKSRYKVWPSAYASGALVKCRKKGAANWGNSTKKEEFELDEFKTQYGDKTKLSQSSERKSLGRRSSIKDGSKKSGYESKKEFRDQSMKLRKHRERFGDLAKEETTVDEACWKGYEKKGMKTMFGKRYPNCVKKTKKEEVEITDAYGETYAVIQDVVKPEPLKPSVNPIDYETYDIDKMTEAVRLPARTGNLVDTYFNFRGKYFSLKMFFPQVSVPKKSDVQDQINKVYPGAKLQSYRVTDYEPGQPVLHAEGAIADKMRANLKAKKKSWDEKGEKAKKDGYDALDKVKKTQDDLDKSDYIQNVGESAWQRKEGKNKAGGLNEKGRKSYEKENPGSDLKAPSKKVGNPRRASFCARMKGMKSKLTSAKTARDPDSRINKSLRKWNC